MNADTARKVSLCVAEATYREMKRTGVMAKPPAGRATALRYRVPNGFNPEEYAAAVRDVLAADGVNVHVKVARGGQWLNIGYQNWKPEYTENVRKKRGAEKDGKEGLSEDS